jgi:hypothetical protein
MNYPEAVSHGEGRNRENAPRQIVLESAKAGAIVEKSVRRRLQFGVLGAASMGEAGAGVGIIRGSLHVGLRAFLGPPAGSI